MLRCMMARLLLKPFREEFRCKEKKRAKDSQWFKDKALLMEAKEKGAVLDAEAEAFLVDHEDVYDSDVDEEPYASASFMANLLSIGGTHSASTSQVNEVPISHNQFFANVDYLLAHEMHQEEHYSNVIRIDENTRLIQRVFNEQVVPFHATIKQHLQNLNEQIYKDITEYMRIFYELDTEYEQTVLEKKSLLIEKKNILIQNECLIADSIAKDVCSIVIASNIVVPPSSTCLCEELRLNCDREHSKVVELEAEILKKQQMLNESEKRCAFIEKNHVNLQVKFQKYKECLQNQRVCDNFNSTASNAIFEINTLKAQLQGKDDTIRNLQTQINITSMLNVGPTIGSFDKHALETELIQLKDALTSLRIQNDGSKVENANLNQRYLELSKANTLLRTTSMKKIAALNAEIAKLRAEVVGNTGSGPTEPQKPKVLALGMYTISSKYIVPTPMPKKQQVTF
ncbi:hypothetical protein Tco_0720967 [Tanacetum coccineum]